MTTHSTNVPFLGTLRPEGFIHHMMDMFAIRKQRRDLAKLDDRALRDIGVSRYEAVRESCRPVWDVPHHWAD